MTRRVVGAAVLAQTAVLCVLTAPAGAADSDPPSAWFQRPPIELFQNVDRAVRVFSINPRVGGSQHRYRLELEGARAQAQDWLHEAGFSLLEERDVEGQRSYAVLSGALVAEWPMVRLRLRMGAPQLSAGLRVRQSVPAVGLTIPWRDYAFDLEGVQEKNLGYLFMATLSRTDPHGRFQYGIAFPMAVGSGPSVGALLQVRMRFDQ